MKIKKGDLIKVIYGAFRGKTGHVERVERGSARVWVTGVNLVKRHLRQNSGGSSEVLKPIAVSKLAVVCPKCQKTSRLGYRLEGNRKVRFCKSCKVTL